MTIIKPKFHLLAGISAQTVAMFVTLLLVASFSAHACTIFVLTDTNRALFCNNEDWSDTKTRIWFLPAGDGCYGAVYVGFDDGFAQGGMNTEGLAYDWVSGYNEKWEPNPNHPSARGNSSQRMLETSKTVEDAIAFYKQHYEPAFSHAKILVADKTGASVMIGAKDGKLQVEPEKQCRGFGYGHKILDAALEKPPQPTVANGFKILHDCRQPGLYATRYSNIYDLKTGDIFLNPFPDHDDQVKLNLTAELKKGSHYYDMSQIQEQLTQSPQPLPIRMKRFPVDDYKPIPDKEPEVTAHVRALFQNAALGQSRADDYTAEQWKKLGPLSKQIQAQLKVFGDLKTMTLVDRGDEKGQRSYRYRIEFANVTIVQHIVLDSQNKFVGGGEEALEIKPGVNLYQNKITGIGVALEAKGTNLVINAIVPGSPAASHKDIHPGDRIIAIAQEEGPAVPVDTDKLAQTVKLIRGPAATTVRLTIASPGEADAHARVVSIVRAEFNTSATKPK